MEKKKAFTRRLLSSQKLRGVMKSSAAKLCLGMLVLTAASDLSAGKKNKKKARQKTEAKTAPAKKKKKGRKTDKAKVEAVKIEWPAISKDKQISSSVGQQMIEADWLFQANHNPDQKRIEQEIAWARDLADRIGKMNGAPKLDGYLNELATLEEKLKTETDHKKLYIQVRVVKRKIAFSNPLIDFDKILMVDAPYPDSKSDNHESAHRNGIYTKAADSKLQILDGLTPSAPVRDLLPEKTDAYVWRPDLSYDGKKVLFCKKDRKGPSFDLFEVNVDGSGMKQLTKSPYDDIDPIYLPDDKIMFCTTRANSYVRCLPTSPSFVLAKAEADGQNIRIISRNNEPDFFPTMLDNGSVLYTRWEYTERPLWRLQGLWTTNQDGTGTRVYWGNRSRYPDMLVEARPIPGTNKVMFNGVGHHIFHIGSLGILNVDEGREFPDGITKITTDLAWSEVGDPEVDCPPASPNYHVSGNYSSYKSPYPIGEEDFLVSIRDGGAKDQNGLDPRNDTPHSAGWHLMHDYSTFFSLYLMDIHGNKELIYKGDNNVWYAMPVKARKRPPVRPDLVKWPKVGEKAEEGIMYSADVYEGTDIPRGEAKYLRIIQMDAKTYSTNVKTFVHAGPAVSIVQRDGVKRFLGTVPVEDDGSVHFKVPSGKALHFQLLDKDFRMIQIMRSFTGVMPGEARGCVGCHEQTSSAPVAFSGRAKAMKRGPSTITPPPWGQGETISYLRFAQPILDKYCGECHQGDKNPKARKKLDLTLRGGLAEKGIKDPELLPFKEPYLTLVGRAWRSPANSKLGEPGVGIAGAFSVEGIPIAQRKLGAIPPRSILSYTSPLIKMVREGTHHKVKIEGEDLRRLMAWVDSNCVYRGEKEIRMIDDYPGGADFPVPMLIKNAPKIDRLQPFNDVID